MTQENIQLSILQDEDDITGYSRAYLPGVRRVELKFTGVCTDIEHSLSAMDTYTFEMPYHVFQDYTKAMSNLGSRAWEEQVRNQKDEIAWLKARLQQARSQAFASQTVAEQSQKQARTWKDKYLALREKARLG